MQNCMSDSTVMFSGGLGQCISCRKEKVSTPFILFILFSNSRGLTGLFSLVEGTAKERERKVVLMFSFNINILLECLEKLVSYFSCYLKSCLIGD